MVPAQRAGRRKASNLPAGKGMLARRRGEQMAGAGWQTYSSSGNGALGPAVGEGGGRGRGPCRTGCCGDWVCACQGACLRVSGHPGSPAGQHWRQSLPGGQRLPRRWVLNLPGPLKVRTPINISRLSGEMYGRCSVDDKSLGTLEITLYSELHCTTRFAKDIRRNVLLAGKCSKGSGRQEAHCLL